MRIRFGRIAEVGGLAVLEDRRNFDVTMMLYLATLRWAFAADAQGLVACVDPAYRRVYSKLMLFEVLGECKRHHRFLGAPSIPIGLDLTTVPARYRSAQRGAWDAQLHELFSQPASSHRFGELGSATYLQWSDDEISTMIKAEQLRLRGEELRYVARYYAVDGMARVG